MHVSNRRSSQTCDSLMWDARTPAHVAIKGPGDRVFTIRVALETADRVHDLQGSQKDRHVGAIVLLRDIFSASHTCAPIPSASRSRPNTASHRKCLATDFSEL